MTTNKKTFTLRASAENLAKIKVIANKHKRSAAMHIEYLIEKEIEKYEKDNGPIDIK